MPRTKHPTPEQSPLPGEFEQLDWNPGRGPIKAAEALGVARRLGRTAQARGRDDLTTMLPPVELPPADSARAMVAFRLPPLVLAYARARAFAENRTLTEVVEECLRGYGSSGPMTVPVWVVPPDTDTAEDTPAP